MQQGTQTPSTIDKQKIIIGLIIFAYTYLAAVFVNLTAISDMPESIKWLSLPTMVTTLAIVLAFHLAMHNQRYGYATIFLCGLIAAGQMV